MSGRSESIITRFIVGAAVVTMALIAINLIGARPPKVSGRPIYTYIERIGYFEGVGSVYRFEDVDRGNTCYISRGLFGGGISCVSHR